MSEMQKKKQGTAENTPQESLTVVKLKSKAAQAYGKVVSNKKATKLNKRGK